MILRRCRRARQCMLLFRFPKHRRVFQGNKITSKSVTCHRTASLVQVIISPKLKICVDWKKKALVMRRFKITKNTKGNILMCLSRLMHKLSQSMNRVCQVMSSDGKGDQTSHQTTIWILIRENRTFGFAQRVILFHGKYHRFGAK